MNLQKNSFQKRPGPILLIVEDGIGISKAEEGNAVFTAKTPYLDKLMSQKLHTQLKAHGVAVGLPTDKDMGNSEVGHNALGAGRVFAQGAKRVNKSIEDKSLFSGESWKNLVEQVKKFNSTFHFIGLLSDGGVHSNISQLIAMIKELDNEDVLKVRLHMLTDGRDVGSRTALTYVDQIEELFKEINAKQNRDYKIASGGGRMIVTMDRYEADWSIVERGWKTHVLGDAPYFNSAKEAIEKAYEDPEINDQYVPPFVIAKDGKPVGTIEDHDSVLFFNFRGDRAIEFSKAMEDKDFKAFDRKRVPDVYYVGMLEYDGDLHIPSHFLVQPPNITNTMSDYFCKLGIKSYAIAETQKFGHVTYFWNGNKSGYICPDQEKFVQINSDTIPFDQEPAMKAYEVTDRLIKDTSEQSFDFIRVNFANGDMVGHTGNMDAAVKAVEVVDECLGKLMKYIDEQKGILLVMADHGNADEMFTMKDGKKTLKTSHTLAPVPFAIYDPLYNGEYNMKDLDKKGLTNVAATVFNLFGYNAPEDYDPSLIEFK